MSVEVRYRTLDGRTVGERVGEVDQVGQLLQILDTEAPFGATVAPSSGGHEFEMVVGLRSGLGAIYYTDEGGSWYSRGTRPRTTGRCSPRSISLRTARSRVTVLRKRSRSSWPLVGDRAAWSGRKIRTARLSAAEAARP